MAKGEGSPAWDMLRGERVDDTMIDMLRFSSALHCSWGLFRTAISVFPLHFLIPEKQYNSYRHHLNPSCGPVSLIAFLSCK